MSVEVTQISILLPVLLMFSSVILGKSLSVSESLFPHLPIWIIVSFVIWIPFISFYSLIAVARTSKTMLNSSGESGHPCLPLDLRGNTFAFSP